jgi:serine protease Do
MKLLKVTSAATAVTGLIAAVILATPLVSGQAPPPPPPDRPMSRGERIDILGVQGSSIGASIRDVDDNDRQRAGVVVEEVEPGSAAERGGLRKADIITRFAGEDVRSARQFGRLVQETPAGRAVSATVLRDGKTTELKITPEDRPRAGIFLDGDRRSRSFDSQHFEEQMGRLNDRLRNFPPFDLNLDLDIPGSERPRLGVTVQPLTPQLAGYFGAKEGMLVASVTDDSPASRAGLKAGDVIVSVNGQNVSSRADITRAVSGAGANVDITIAIVRDKKESSVKARLDDVRAQRPAPRRVVRPVSLRQA